MRLLTLPQFFIRLIHGQRCQVGLRTMSACALATLMVGPAQAQLIEDWAEPAAGGGVVGSAAVGQATANGGYRVTADDPGSVYVGPGGVTNPSGVPSVLTPGQHPSRTRYVNQPYANGPFVQAQPIYQDPGSFVSAPCEVGCDIRCYGSVEALYFRREHDERFTLSQNTRIEPFDYEWGGRVTVGRLLDCVNGFEVSYAGPFEWERQSVLTGAGLQSKLSAVGLPASSISAFNNATVHQQQFQARLNTVEANRRWWAWDIFSTLIGIRVVDYREEYAFGSASPAGVGLYQDEMRNLMVGPQVGGEFMTPLGLRTLVGIKGKGALLANFTRNEALLQNAGAVVVNGVDSDVDIAGLIELGTFVKYSITPSIRVMAGYEVWYIPGAATIPGQSLNFVTPDTAAKVFANDELLLHGASFGAQVLF